MNKIVVRLWIVGLLLVAMGQNKLVAQGKRATIEGLNYYYYDSGTASIIKNRRQGFAVYPYQDSEYVIPETVTIEGAKYQVKSIGPSAFYGSSVRRIELPGSLETIENGAFQDSKLSEITIPNSVTSISSFAFANTEITQLTIPAHVTSIGNYVANGQKLRNIVVEKDNTAYRDFDGVLCSTDGTLIQFPGARTGTYVTPSSVKNIGDGGLKDIDHLDKLVLSEGIETISYYAFSPTSSLSLLVMGSTVKRILSMPTFKTDGEAAFYCFAKTPPTASFDYETLKYVTLYVPKGYKEAYQKRQMWNLFKEIREMEDGATIDKLSIQYNEPTYGDFPVNHYQVLPVMLSEGVYYILDESAGEAKVDKSGKYASDYDSWNSIYRQEHYDIPANVTVDDKEYRVTEIVDGAFERSNVRELILPEGLIRIGQSAFFDSKIETLDLPSTVKEIGSFAFGGETPICSVICRATIPPTCERRLISPEIENAPLYVPEESIESYRQAPVWSEFKDIRAIGSTGITSALDSRKKPSGSYYDLQGRRMQRPQQPGIYIQGDKKVIVKKALVTGTGT